MVHKMLIKNRTPEKVMTGASTEVFLDGKCLHGVTRLSFDVAARGLAVLRLEMYVDAEFELGSLAPTIIKDKACINTNKAKTTSRPKKPKCGKS